MDIATDSNASTTASSAPAYDQGATEMFMRSSHMWALGCHRIGSLMVTSAQQQFDRTVSTWLAVNEVKSVKDALDLQTKYHRTSREHAMAATKQLMDATNRLAQDTVFSIRQGMGSSSPKV